jgi:hypothetical protein
MQLTREDLAEISTQLEKIDDLGIEVNQVRTGRHTVFLKRENPREGKPHHVVVGISDQQHHYHEHPTRTAR